MIKVKSLKLANSIKCGATEETFLTNKRFDIKFRDSVVIECRDLKRDDVVCTSIFNAAWWVEDTSEDVPTSDVYKTPATAAKKPLKAES